MTETYIDAIKKPITEEENTALETEEFIFLEEEMTKFSSMRENSLDWVRAEKTAVEILSKQSKDFRILAHLLLCLQHDRDAKRFILSIQVLAGFIEPFWEASKPKIEPVKKEIVIKKKILKQMLIRSEQAMSKVDLTEGDRALLPDFSKALDHLEKVVSKTGLEYEDYWKFSAEFERRLPVEVFVQKQSTEEQKTKKNDSSEQVTTTSPSPSSIEVPKLVLNAENDREIGQTFFKMASFLNGSFEKDPLGYRVRRFALWFDIASMPPLKKNGNTEMMAVPNNIVDEFSEALSANCTMDLLKNIEQIVSTYPFWITGSYISSLVAESIGMDDVSIAIQEETNRFIKRIPDLLDATFSDGTPFADKKTKRWLAQSGASSTGESGEWQTKLQDAIELAKQGRFKNGLNILEKGITASKQPRDRFYWRLAYADFLGKTGMKTLANETYSSLNSEINGFEVLTWEPLLIDELQGKIKLKKEKSMIEKVKGLKQ
ncbi:MAG: type VI secretion system protein TssA [Methylococcaceae bacterium]|nr:type VI secretion system protein TssA [Methylococcaceae bacterium]